MTEFNAAPYDPVSPERWAYLKKLKVGPGTMIHTSCEAYMIENPFGKHLPLVPFVAKPGRTYKSPLREYKRQLVNLLAVRARSGTVEEERKVLDNLDILWDKFSAPEEKQARKFTKDIGSIRRSFAK